MIEDALMTLALADATLTALVGTRVYCGRPPQGAALPLVVFSQVSCVRDIYHGGTVRGARSRFQFSVVATTALAAKTISDALKALYHGYRGTVGGDTIFLGASANEFGRADLDLGFGVDHDFLFTHSD